MSCPTIITAIKAAQRLDSRGKPLTKLWRFPYSTQKSALADLYCEIINKYPIVLLEDPFAQDD